MLQNYFKIAFRNLLRHKGYSLINITGFALGIACCILIMLNVLDELSYDRFNEKSDRTHRVALSGRVGGNDFDIAVSCAPIGFTLVREFPEVEQATRIRNTGFPVIRYEDKVFSEERFWGGDSTFFDVFTTKFIAGTPEDALTKPNTVVLTQSTAQKYFGDENPMGKILNADNRTDWEVTGIVEDFPANSHFHFDFMGSLTTNGDSRSTIWLSNNYYTYIVLKEGAIPEQVEAKFPNLIKKYVGPQIQKIMGASLEDLFAAGGAYGYFLQPLNDIHLNSDLDNEIEPNGDGGYVLLFMLIAFGILLIACINFMNLATARSANRSKEVGIRKTLGSNKLQLIRQFLAETVFLTFISIVLAFIFVYIFLPGFNQMAGKQLSFAIFDVWYFVPAILGFTFLVGLVAGSYPAFFLAAFEPVKVLKGSLSSADKSGSPTLRGILVVFQFAISIILLIGTMVVNDQLNYVQNKKLGFNKEQVVVVKKTDDIGRQIDVFIETLHRNSNIISAANSSTLPGKNFNTNIHNLPGSAGEEAYLIHEMRADVGFIETYQSEVAQGRYFSKDFATDSTGIVINETAANLLGFGDDAIGKIINEMGNRPENQTSLTVVGVLKDLHFEFLHQKIRPMAIKLFRKNGFGRYVSVRVAPDNVKETLAYIKETWHQFAGAQAFEYAFFDQDFAKLYESEATTQRIMTLFATLAVIIACLGLLGLASFIAEQRTKEIGIRKVLGASVAKIVFLLSRQFTKWVVVANIISWPIAYFLMNSWLENFAYRTNLELTSFILAGCAALFIALLTVGYQTVKAAYRNPVDSLHYE